MWPRPFVDVPPGARFLPQAAELNDGRVVTFFSLLIEKLKRDGGNLPGAYPRTTETGAGTQQRDAYWGWFAQHRNADEAVQVVEDVIGDGGRPRWIDYRPQPRSVTPRGNTSVREPPIWSDSVLSVRISWVPQNRPV